MTSTIEKKAIEELERLLLLDAPERTIPATRRKIPVLLVLALGVAATLLVSPLVSTLDHHSTFEFTLPRPEANDDPARPLTKNQNLSPNRMLLSGIVDPSTMTAAYYLATYITNTGSTSQEAEFRIKLPQGAAVTRATLWVNGTAQEAAFTDVSTARDAYTVLTRSHADPLLVQYIDEETVSVKASPVIPGNPMKLRIGITAPIGTQESGIGGQLPHIEASNFADSKLDVHIETAHGRFSSVFSHHQENYSNPMNFSVDATAIKTPVAVPLTHSATGGYVLATAGDDGVLHLERIERTPVGTKVINDRAAAIRLSTLWAKQEIKRLIDIGKEHQAIALGHAFRLISPVSSAVVLEKESDYAIWNLDRKLSKKINLNNPEPMQRFLDANGNELHLQGATNGLIGPQSSDAIVIMGENAASTVRVNRLAQIENAANSIASSGGPIASGVTNWLFASSRDANLFDGGAGMFAILAAFVVLPLAILNFAPAFACLSRGTVRGITRQPGALRLLLLGCSLLALALVMPVASQCLAVAAAYLLIRRKISASVSSRASLSH